MPIICKDDTVPTVEQVIALYNNAGLPRPTHDTERIQKCMTTLILSSLHGMGIHREVFPVALPTGAGTAT